MGVELVAFLRRRLDEDEVAARAGSSGPWWLIQNHFEGDNTVQIRSAQSAGEAVDGQWALVARLTAMPDTPVTRNRMAADGLYLERFCPTRSLADIAARGAVVDVCERIVTAGLAPAPCSTDVPRRERRNATTILRALAQVYRGHPEFSAEWADEQPPPEHGTAAPEPVTAEPFVPERVHEPIRAGEAASLPYAPLFAAHPVDDPEVPSPRSPEPDDASAFYPPPPSL